jgi:hypothetical protein
MHTTVEAAHKADIAATIDLFYHFILSLDFAELERERLFGSSYLTVMSPEQQHDGAARDGELLQANANRR